MPLKQGRCPVKGQGVLGGCEGVLGGCGDETERFERSAWVSNLGQLRYPSKRSNHTKSLRRMGIGLTRQ